LADIKLKFWLPLDQGYQNDDHGAKSFSFVIGFESPSSGLKKMVRFYEDTNDDDSKTYPLNFRPYFTTRKQTAQYQHFSDKLRHCLLSDQFNNIIFNCLLRILRLANFEIEDLTTE
jgi:hypothetical protein